ncbi:tripartite motif-containing protein 16-like [Ictalurus furcatus]|uniref:tripartite motif-containing protein 16-like n=1 Tax=Ictalurus furcatus TaxID=66913 RepID=UPI002350715C|nr:tripartite motif-containing protein 16-like [Ictalurus furcatus]
MMDKLKMSAYAKFLECDFCTGRKSKAIKSCLVCLASFCETHLQPHYESPAFKKHKLVEASRRLQEQICSQHGKLLEVYCHTEQQCICMLCMLHKHKGHDTVSAAAGRADKQRQLTEMYRDSQQRIQHRENKLQELRKAVRCHKGSAQAAVEESERILTELIRSIVKRQNELTALIRAQEKAAVSEAEEVMKQLEQEIAELKRRDSEMEELSHTEDPIYFLQMFRSASAPPVPADIPGVIITSFHPFNSVVKSVSQLREKLEQSLKEDFEQISRSVTEVQIIPPDDHKTREEFLKYSCQFTLDPDTANKHLCLSERNTVVTCSETAQLYPDHAERFDNYWQVLCRESVCGRCYWEVEWSGSDGVSIVVSYKDISRKGNFAECVFGASDQSWRLLCTLSDYSFYHRCKEIKIPVMPSSSRIGVYVDHRAGILSFYGVSDTMKLLHRVHTTFTQPLYPGFLVCKGSAIKLC